LRRKCGSSDLRARRNEVRCENSVAYKKRCLNVRSATASRKKNSVDSMQRSNRAISINVRSLPTKPNTKSLNLFTAKFKVNSREHYLVSTSFL
jgi:hypothetical protein